MLRRNKFLGMKFRMMNGENKKQQDNSGCTEEDPTILELENERMKAILVASVKENRDLYVI